MTPRGALPAPGEQTRRLLLEATVRIVVRAGWGGVSTRKVAAEAGVNQALVHYHFDSLDGLLRAAVRAVTEALLEGPMSALGAVADAGDAILAMVEQLTEAGAEGDATVFLYEALLASRRDDALRAELAGLLRSERAVLVAWVRSANPDADADAVAALLAAALDGIYVHRLVDPTVDPRVLAGPVRALLAAPPHRKDRP